eukprot:10660747-Heterocapsa_arctica.AAC.1
MRIKAHTWHGTFADMRAGGCIIGISREISNACVVGHAVVVPGRIHRISLNADEGALHVINVHLVPQWSTAEFRAALRAIAVHVAEFMNDLIVVAGDFNF